MRRIRLCGKVLELRLVIFGGKIQSVFFPIHFNFNTCGCVFHPTFEIETCGKVINKGSKADPLNDACDVDAQSLHYVFAFSMSQSVQASRPSPVVQEVRKGGHARVENLHAALEIIHFEVDVGQEVDLVDDQHIHAAIRAWIFVRLVIAFRDGGDQDGLVRAQV